MADSRSLFNVSATAGSGLAALYYGVSWFFQGLKMIHAANQIEQSPEIQNLANLAKETRQGVFDPSLAGASAYIQSIDNQTRKATRLVRWCGAGVTVAGGLLLYGAYGAGRSLATGEEMDNAATLVNAAAATLGAVKAFHRI